MLIINYLFRFFFRYLENRVQSNTFFIIYANKNDKKASRLAQPPPHCATFLT